MESHFGRNHKVCFCWLCIWHFLFIGIIFIPALIISESRVAQSAPLSSKFQHQHYYNKYKYTQYSYSRIYHKECHSRYHFLACAVPSTPVKLLAVVERMKQALHALRDTRQGSDVRNELVESYLLTP